MTTFATKPTGNYTDMPSKNFYRSTVLSIMLLVLASCGSKKSTLTRQNQSLRHDIVEYGKKYLNKPYRYAGKGPHSFDCSGYTSFVFKRFGYNLSASSAAQSRQAITIQRKEDLNVGDLVFFEGRRHNGRVEHVGIVTDIPQKGRFNFIHASTSSGVIISSSEEPYYKARYLRGGNILKDIPNIKTRSTNIYNTQVSNNKGQNIWDEPTTVMIKTEPNKPKTENSPTIANPNSSNRVKKKQEEKKKNNENKKIREAIVERLDNSLTTPPNYTVHEVKPGETLYSISQKYKCTVEELKKWNPKIVSNAIYAGDKLLISQ